MSIPKKASGKKLTRTERAIAFFDGITNRVKDGMTIKVKLVVDEDDDERDDKDTNYPSSVFEVSIQHMHWKKAVLITAALFPPHTIKFINEAAEWSYPIRLPVSDARDVRAYLITKAKEINAIRATAESALPDRGTRSPFSVYTAAGEALDSKQLRVYLDVLNSDTPADKIPAAFAQKLRFLGVPIPQSLQHHVVLNISAHALLLVKSLQEAAVSLGRYQEKSDKAQFTSRCDEALNALTKYIGHLENK